MKKKLYAGNDPLNIKGDLYMTNQQMDKRTATINLGNTSREDLEKRCLEKAEKIIDSDAFKAFSDQVKVSNISYEKREDAYYNLCMYMRINY